jgi:putative NIF3 family GTP cyclohydrolase 1 type 2
MAAQDEIVAYLDELLDSASFEDYGPNGLQVPGAQEVTLVVTGVSAHRELFERAREAGPRWCSATTACSGTPSRGMSRRR